MESVLQLVNQDVPLQKILAKVQLLKLQVLLISLDSEVFSEKVVFVRLTSLLHDLGFAN